MPSDALTVAVTTGLGVSVLAGILSGICYIITHGLPNTRLVKCAFNLCSLSTYMIINIKIYRYNETFFSFV